MPKTRRNVCDTASPEYRLPKADLDREIGLHHPCLGVEIKCGVNIPKDITVDDMLGKTRTARFSFLRGHGPGKAMRVDGEFDHRRCPSSGVEYLIEKAQKTRSGPPAR